MRHAGQQRREPGANAGATPTPHARGELETAKARLDECGFVVLRNQIPTEEMRLIAETVKGVMREHRELVKRQTLRAILQYQEASLDRLVLHPLCLELAAQVLGNGFHLAETSARWLEPGDPGQELHADTVASGVPEAVLRAPGVNVLVNCLWLLTDFTRANGATLVLPSSHLSGRLPVRGENENDQYLVPIEAPAGSVLVTHGGLWHKGGANTTTTEHRLAVGVVYLARWVDPAAGQWSLLPRSTGEHASVRLLRFNRHFLDCRTGHG